MRYSLIMAASAVAIASVSCSTTVHSDHDHQADFSNYSTYGWYAAAETDTRPTMGANQIVDGRIRRSMAENLSARGYEQAPAESADLLVTYYTSLSSQLRMYTTGWGYGWGSGPYWGFGYGYWPGWGATTVHTYHEGTIIVDIVDRRMNQLVWRGVISRALSKKSSSEEKIHQAMTRVLADFPPA